MRLVVALLSSCAAACALASDQPTVPDFSSYPQAKAFRYFVERQTNAARHVGHVFAMTEFTRFAETSSTALVYWVSDGGAQNWQEQGFPISAGSYRPYPRLSETQLTTLLSVIRQLPPTNALPRIDNLVLVSFRQGTNWVTRSYDKRSPPKVLDRIHEIQRAAWVPNFTVQ